MNTYSIYFLDPIGLVEAELEIEFDTDQQAVDAAFAAKSPFGIELWCGERLLGLFPAPRALAPVMDS